MANETVDWSKFTPISGAAQPAYTPPTAPGAVDWSQFKPIEKQPEQSDVWAGFKTSFKQLPQLGWGLAAITAAGIESAAGEGGLATAAKKFSVGKMAEWDKSIQADSREYYDLDKAWESAKEGNFGALVDWTQYAVGYGVGQGLQVLGTAGVGKIGAQLLLKPAVEKVAGTWVGKEAAEIAAKQLGAGAAAADVSALAATDAIKQAAVKNVAVKLGENAALAGYSFGMEGGEIGGDLAKQSVEENRSLTGSELARGLGATILAGSLEYGENLLTLGGLKGKLPTPFAETGGVGGKLGRAATGTLISSPVEGGTEYFQTGIEEYGKGKEENLLPFNQSPEAQRQAFNAAGLGAVGGATQATVGGLISGARAPTDASLDRSLDQTEAALRESYLNGQGPAQTIANVVAAPDLDAAINAAEASVPSMDELLQQKINDKRQAAAKAVADQLGIEPATNFPSATQVLAEGTPTVPGPQPGSTPGLQPGEARVLTQPSVFSEQLAGTPDLQPGETRVLNQSTAFRETPAGTPGLQPGETRVLTQPSVFDQVAGTPGLQPGQAQVVPAPAAQEPTRFDNAREEARQRALREMSDSLPRFRYTPWAQGQKEETPSAEPDLVSAYVEQMRQTNTPAAQAFVHQFDTGRITPADVQSMLDMQNPQNRAPAQPEVPSNATPMQSEGLQIERSRARPGPTLDLKSPEAAVAERAQQQGEPDISPELAQQRLEAARAPEPVTPTQAQQYIAALRLENTDQARALVKEYEAGRVTDQDIADAVNAQRRYQLGGVDLAQNRIEGAAAQAPGPAQGLQVETTGARAASPALTEAVALYGDRPLTGQDLTVEGATARVERAAQGAQPAQQGGIVVDQGLEPRGAFRGRNEAIRFGNTNVPRPARIGNQPAASYSEQQLQTIVANDNLPAITRRGAQIELLARQQEQRSAQPATPAGVTPGGIIIPSEQRTDDASSAAGSQTEATQQGKPVVDLGNWKPVDVAKLSTQSQTQTGTISRQTHRMVSLLGSMFGKKVVVFESDNAQAPDGFVFDNDSKTIHLNVKSGVSHLVVFGHELLHQLKRDNAPAYDALAKVIKLNAGANLNVAGIRGNMEELTADVVGNRFREVEFWQNVFREVLASGPDVRASQRSAMKLGSSVVNAVGKMVKALKGMTGFNTDSMVANLTEVKSAVTKALATYAQTQRGEATQLIREQVAGQAQAAPTTGGEVLASARRTPDTPEFKKWFGQSKVVDENGRPLVLYHGTNADFSTFSTTGKKYLNGFKTRGAVYLTPSSKSASWAAEELPAMKGQTNEGANVMPVYASIRKPFITGDWSTYPGWATMAWLKLQGYDGVVVSQDGTVKNASEILVFNATQIKSAIGNSGQFDPATPSIVASERRPDFTAPEDRLEVSTTRPVPAPKKGRTSNSYDEKWVIDGKDVRSSKKHVNAIVRALREYNTLSGKGNASKLMQELHDVVVENLLWLHDLVPENVRARAKLWYDGANRIANDWTRKYGVSLRQSSGVLAVLSPQMDWFKNVSLGERVITIWKNRQNEAWSPAMTAWLESWVNASKDVDTKASRQAILEEARQLQGVTLSEMNDRQAALYIRAFDEAYHERQYRLVTPEGGFGDYVTNNDEGDASVTWGGFDTIEKAVSILNDGSFRNIDEMLGDEHKVRNFYNNIIRPGSADGHVTIDTHAVAAALIKALSGSTREVADNFGAAGQNAETGASGTYGLFADAYRDAAAQRGILPREMQSITWEAVRALFPASIKDQLAPQVDAVWNRFRKGEITRDQAREEVRLLALTPEDNAIRERYNRGELTREQAREEVQRLAEAGRPMAWDGSDAGAFASAGGTSFNTEIDEDPAARPARTLPPEVAKDKIQVNLSANTSTIPGIAALQAQATGGDLLAHRLLQDIALDNLRHLLAGTSARVKADGVTGLYGGNVESGLSLTVTFADEDRPAVLAALAKFADNFNQEQVHVRRGVKAKAGTTFGDGSYATPVYRWELKKTLSRKQIENVITQSGLYGLTFGDDFVEAYYVGDPSNEAASTEFGQAVDRAGRLLGRAAESVGRSVERLWAYGDSARGLGFDRIQGDVPAGTGLSSETANRVASYLNAVKGKDGKPALGRVKTFDQAAEITPEQDQLQVEIARAYDALPDNDLRNPRVRKAYNELSKEVLRQFRAMPIKLEVYTGTGEPYKSSADMRRDVLNNNHLYIYGTRPDTFGPAGQDFSTHPLLGDSGERDVNGYKLLFNDLLRGVHDYYAHAMSPAQFGPKGEEAAWKNHMSMTPSMWARWALTMETRAQNSWVNFRDGLDRTIPISQRSFAPQKAALLPVKFTLTGDRTVDRPMKEFIKGLNESARQGSKPARKVKASEKRSPLEDPAGLIDKLASVEGEAWAREQRQHSDQTPHSVPYIARVYEEAQGYLAEDPELGTVREVMRDIGGPKALELYGAGGYNRYLVQGDGSLRPDGRLFANKDKLAQANNILASEKRTQTDTPQFKNWFGDSKVVDENGEPLVLYRGVAGFESIPDKALNAEAREGYATFASNNPAISNTYSNPNWGRFGDQRETGATVPIYVKADRIVEFPVRTGSDGWRTFNKFEFDRRAQALRPGEVLVVRGVTDTGPRSSVEVDPGRGWSYPSDIYAWGPGTSVKSAIGNNGEFNPENPDITASEKRQTDTPEFRRWFGDSKVVDENGEPLVVYHGTNKTDSLADEPDQAIRQFDSYVNWFTVDPYHASGYATQDGRQIEGASTYPAYLSLQNPLRLRGDLNDKSTYAEFRRETGLDVRPGPYEDEVIDGVEQQVPRWWMTNSPSFAEAAEAAGYDGVIAEEGGTRTYGVLYQDPSKIKSAIGNTGAFATDNPDITASEKRVGDTSSPEFKEWFGDSQLVDADGEPLILYHGTQANNIRVFKRSEDGALGPGIYLTQSTDAASSYAGDGGVVEMLYARLERPLVVYTGSGAEPALQIARDDKFWKENFFTRAAARKWAEGQVEDWAGIQDPEFPQMLKDAGYDGVILKNPETGEIVEAMVPSAYQVKSAINDGEWSRSNPDIYASEKRSAPRSIYGGPIAPTWTAPGERKGDGIRRYLQDKMIDTKRVVDAIKSAIGRIDDKWNAYLQEELYHGRTAKATKDFLQDELRPLMQAMNLNKVTIADFEEYLHNRHAEERNAQIAKVNPNMPDGGSGIDTADARAYLAGLAPAKRQVYDALARRVDAITKETRELLVRSGLETRETIDAWEQAYGRYVPLFREDTDYGAGPAGSGTGQGFSVRGPASRRATGSNRPVVDILANVAMQREKAIVRAEKTRVGTAVYGLAVQHPNTDFWLAVDPDAIKDPAKLINDLVSMGINPVDAQNIVQEPKQTYLDPRTGLVTQRINPALRGSDNVLALRVNGSDKYVFFNRNNEQAQNMVRALKNLDADQLGRVMSISAQISRYFASVNTQYNPIFGGVNLLRDTQGALFNLTTTPIADRKGQVMAGILPAIAGIYGDLRAQRAGRARSSGAWATLWEEFQREGGQTGFRDMFSNSEERAKSLQDEIDRMQRKGYDPRRLVDPNNVVFGWLSDYNETLENAVRLSAYKAAKDKGLSNQQAASIAKNLTVNFNRKGEIGVQAGALYAFFNASVQGTARLAETLTGPAGRKILAGGLLLGTAQALLLAAAGFKDDEPPDFLKERNLIIPTSGGKYLSLPMPLGFNVIPNTSRVLTEWALSGFKNTAKRMAALTGAFLEAFNPIGNAGWSVQTIAPTFADPLVALAENRDWTGKPIAKEDRSGTDPTPGYTRAKETASWLSKELSYYLNLASGGTKYKPGVISPTPDQIDYLIGQLTGGVGREALKVQQTVESRFTGEELPTYKVPVLGRFYGDTRDQASTSARFYENLTRINEHENEIKGRAKNREPVNEYTRENPEARLVPLANKIERDLSELRRRKRDMLERGASPESIKIIEQQITRKMKQLNDRVDAVGAR